MTDQLALCLDETAFDRFHADNPKVYETLVRLAREWVSRTGRHKLGIATQERDLAGLFDLRTSKADLWIAGAVA